MADLRTRLDEPPDGRFVDQVPGPQPGEERAPTDAGDEFPAAPPAPAADDEVAAAPPVPVNPIARTYNPPSYWGLLVTILAALIVVLAAGDVALYVQGTDDAAGQRDEALTAARQVALDLCTLGATDADEKLERLTDSTTEPLREELGGYSAVLRETLIRDQVSANGSVRSAGLERIDGESAVALVAVMATVTNTSIPDGVARQYRLAVELRRDDGRWRASAVGFVP